MGADAVTYSRRTLIQAGAGLAAAASLAACGADTTGGGDFTMVSSQFTPVEEKQRFESVLATHVTDYKVGFNPMPAADLQNQLKAQVDAGQVKIGLVGALHGDYVPIPTYLEDLGDELVGAARDAGVGDDMLALGRLGGTTQKYIPWMQATYVVAVHKKALQWLPAGADVNRLTYDQYLAWAQAAAAANGKPVFGFPAGPKGLHHRFYQGFLLPSFTGGVVTRFTSADAVAGWTWLQQLWASTNPASTNYDFMQEPLAAGEVLVAWDHVARLVGAPKDNPDDWLMVPSPTGPKGLGHMLVVGGLAIPKGGDTAAATKVIKALLQPATQLDVLKQNAFFPVVKATVGDDLPAPIKLEATAVAAQQSAPGALVALPPTGLGSKDGELSQVFKDCFTEICLNGKAPQTVLSEQATKVQTILDAVQVPCWAPDPAGPGTCRVG